MTTLRLWLCWGVLSLVMAGFFTYRLRTEDSTVFLPGKTTHGHYQIEMSCESCHTPFGGVREQACLDCHAEELKTANDSHPKKKFTDPRNAERVAHLDARQCVACHVEHRPDMTNAIGVTLPQDYCFHCHAGVGGERPSHRGMEFNTCASAGCHNFHDNRALYEDFLVAHNGEPEIRDLPVVVSRMPPPPLGPPLTMAHLDAPSDAAVTPALRDDWVSTAHAEAGVNCTGCHEVATESGAKQWTDHPAHEVCASCHKPESAGFLAGKHGMRLAAGLSAMSPALARLPMEPEAHSRQLGCGSCHVPHQFNTRHAAVDACLECHADTHSQSYKASSHFALWQSEAEGRAASGSGVSCATCHLPRETSEAGGDRTVRVQHNQNWNLRPNEKMIRDVCLSCHGLAFSIDALADRALIEANFRGRPSRHIESIDMAARRVSKH